MTAPDAAGPIWTAQDVVAATDGTWWRAPPDGWVAGGACYYHGLFQPGDLLILRSRQGELGMTPEQAAPLLAAASGLVCSTPAVAPDGPWPVFVVPETYAALMDLGRYARGCFRGRVYGVTGSAGKTTICHLLAFALSRLGPTVQTSHNTNLPPGVARTLAGLPGDVDHAVLELAIGRMGPSTRLARPSVAIFSNVTAAHMEYHRSIEQIADTKALIFTGLTPDGVAIVNRDMAPFERVVAVAHRHAARVVTYGEHPDAMVRLLDHDPDGQVRAAFDGETLTYRLGAPGRHMAVNSLAVLAAVATVGADADATATANAGTLGGADWRGLVLPALADATPVAGRGVEHDLIVDGRRVRLIDDAYNANPASMRAGLALLGDRVPGPGGRRIAVLGDMLELGPDSARYHEALAEPLEAAGVDVAHCVGPQMAHLWRRLPGDRQGLRVDDPADLLAPLRTDLRDGDVLLVKGSHGAGVHRLVTRLVQASHGGAAGDKDGAGAGAGEGEETAS
ncbi:UDP-N-acetylmuramoyl-tripeptide--D-alanyl-D-alanine ligase [Roseospira goensis]|uniref:UDP-N-acetylmuramyl pentapeptide synthase n=1 Tax=Roseospira goensis TaxID=391922 RepID=A0A7W6RX78_9PROT|nr:Mur ligase family protein [Roseospira goensis]MBB4284395.1 UDP-N-acetylmuramyl pentapeptide synthase [Roseospira goensis]